MRVPLAATVTATVVVIAAALACPTAPSPLAGGTAGTSCSADLQCGDGLHCECGACTAPSEVDLPPLCLVEPPTCPPDPSPCYESCGGAEIGEAVCIDALESCEPLGGVLESDCDPDQCRGTQPPGTTCVEGEYVCTSGEALDDGRCITLDCATTDNCVSTCGSATTRPALCVESVLSCPEEGFRQLVSACATCDEPRPKCTADCVLTGTDLDAICDATVGDWACPFDAFPDRSDQCADAGPDGQPDAGPDDADDAGSDDAE